MPNRDTTVTPPGTTIPQALEFRKEMIELSATTGALSPDAYLQELRDAIPKEKKRALAAKAAGDTRKAVDALKRSKLMEDELRGAMEGGIA